jgi:large subunit ribosomal protein L10
MAMSKAKKEIELKEISERFANDELVVVTHNLGLTVAQVTELRRELRKEGATFKVTKNSLAKRALKGTKFEQLGNMFAGPTAIASSQDPIAAAKVAHNFAKKNEKLVIIGGAFGDMILDAAGVERIAKLPSLNEIRSKIVGLLQAPATKLAVVLQTPARNLVGVTAAYGEKK